MKSWYNKNDCQHLNAYQAYYPVPVAAMLWCGVPPDEVQEELNRITPHPYIRGVFTHPFIPCFEVRCRIIHDAIERGALPASRENGKVTNEHIAPERRHVSREHLRAWIAKEHPADKPEFLFDEIERKTHAAINADAFRALQADRDAARAELERAKAWAADTIREMDALRGERDSLRAMVERMNIPGERAETTYLNIIGAMLALMLGKSPAGKPQSIYDNQAAIIAALLGHYEGKPGISARTLEEKFAAAKRSLTAT
ncbi:protein kinase [Tepidiphilus margaritifer]|uniref:protein kinase n=1 Tax=Tepidiphilus margaritifer TaxID=203471 RepID=UPI0012F76DFD|nr:protein kinase [Tepidiphilus margaritifer]